MLTYVTISTQINSELTKWRKSEKFPHDIPGKESVYTDIQFFCFRILFERKEEDNDREDWSDSEPLFTSSSQEWVP
jgi:hypothetical protein